MLTRASQLTRRILPLREVSDYETYHTKHVLKTKYVDVKKVFPKAHQLWKQSANKDNVIQSRGDESRVLKKKDNVERYALPHQFVKSDLHQLPQFLEETEATRLYMNLEKELRVSRDIEPVVDEVDPITPRDFLQGVDSTGDEEMDILRTALPPELDKGTRERAQKGRVRRAADKAAAEEAMKKKCFICQWKKVLVLEPMNTPLLSRFVSNAGDMIPRKVTGTCAKHQRRLGRLIRQCKQMGLLSYKETFTFHHPYSSPGSFGDNISNYDWESVLGSSPPSPFSDAIKAETGEGTTTVTGTPIDITSFGKPPISKDIQNVLIELMSSSKRKDEKGSTDFSNTQNKVKQ